MVNEPQSSKTHGFIAVKMREDIKPLCLVHHKEMSGSDDAGLFSCDEPGCESHWRPVSGYECYRFPAAVPYFGKKFPELVGCQRLGHGHMFVSEFDSTTGIEVWHCSVDGCSELMEREPRDADPQTMLHYSQH
jgi:hypothetical protein